MKVVSLNCNGLRAAIKKGLLTWLKENDPDILCLQEIKAHESDIDKQLIEELGYNHYFSLASKKGYSGVGILSKMKAKTIEYTIDQESIDDEGRYISIDIDNYQIISLYLPSGTTGDIRQKFKYEVLEVVEQKLKQLISMNKKVIIAGDFNIAHKAIDLKNWKQNQKNLVFYQRKDNGLIIYLTILVISMLSDI